MPTPRSRLVVISFALVALTAIAAIASVAAAKAPAPSSRARVLWSERVSVINRTAGKAAVQVSLTVNGRHAPARIVRASFVPEDTAHNACGKSLAGQTSGASAQLTAPHPGASRLTITTTARSTTKVAGKYSQKVFVGSVYLGGTAYECANGAPPAAQAICDYGTPLPGTVNTNATDCGIPVPNSPFWVSKPTIVGNTVVAPRIGIASGYCWANEIDHAGVISWFGGRMTYAVVWICSNGTQLLPILRMWLTASDDLNGYPTCQTRNDLGAPWANYGVPLKFQVPAGLGGRLDVEWSFAVLPPDPIGNKPPIGAEWSSASFYYHGGADGCAQLLAPVTPVA